MAKKRGKKKPFILHGVVKAYFDRCIFESVFSFAIGCITFIIALSFDKLTSQNIWVILSFSLFLSIFGITKAIMIYNPICRETQKVKHTETEEMEIYITKIKKTYQFVSKTLCRISVYTVFSRGNDAKERYYYIPLELDDTDLEKFKKQKVNIQVYQGTKIIKSYPKEDEKKASQHRTLIKQAKEDASGLWADIINAYADNKFETMWPSDISVEYCSINKCGDMIDITLDNSGSAICFNIDKDSIYTSFPKSDKDETLVLSTFENIDSLIAYMKSCIKN